MRCIRHFVGVARPPILSCHSAEALAQLGGFFVVTERSERVCVTRAEFSVQEWSGPSVLSWAARARLPSAGASPVSHDRVLRGRSQAAMSVHGPSVWTDRALQAESDDLEKLVLRFCTRTLSGALVLLAIMDIRAHPISFSERP